MFCPRCHTPNPADAGTCHKCNHPTGYFRRRVHIGRQFIFINADDDHTIALEVDGDVQTYGGPAILSRHKYAVAFGDLPGKEVKKQEPEQPQPRGILRRIEAEYASGALRSLPNQPKLPPPSLTLLTIVSDRKIYKPDDPAALFIVAPDAGGQTARLEIQRGGHKIFEADIPLNEGGLALHTFADTREGEYTAIVTLPGEQTRRAECAFSAAEFTLSPLIATLEEHRFDKRTLTFSLKLLLLSQPYSGPVELGLQCKVCGDKIVATKNVAAEGGRLSGKFDLSGHGGPFHVQVVTPGGNTASVAFPGTGALERRRIRVNPLGQTADMGLLPWKGAEETRGLYLGPGEVTMTPLMLESVRADTGKLTAAAELRQTQVMLFDPRAGTAQVLSGGRVLPGETLDFDVTAPYTLFTVGAFLSTGEPFEGWGIVFKPEAFTAQPGQAIEIFLNGPETGAYCWLLVYDARLEHQSPVPKLAKQIYQSARNAAGNLQAGKVEDATAPRWSPTDDFVGGPRVLRAVRRAPATMRRGSFVGDIKAMPVAMAAPPAVIRPTGTKTAKSLTMVVAPSRMDFPELAHMELFYFEGQASRTVKLGDQIGTWRARAYVLQGIDYRQLTADIQAEKALYAELDLPAIAAEGDDISAAATYHTPQPAELVIATPFGETRQTVQGDGAARFPVKGPCRVEVRLKNALGADWTARDVAPPGVQRVTASRLAILNRGQSIAGEKVVTYASVGYVLHDTITALIGYPFG
ncbi:MAG: hypothetical protein ACE5G8_07165 [Anaerolineae bacterium]